MSNEGFKPVRIDLSVDMIARLHRRCLGKYGIRTHLIRRAIKRELDRLDDQDQQLKLLGIDHEQD